MMKKKNVSGGVKRERKRKRVLRANSLACCSLACLSVRLCPANIHTTRTEQHSTTHTHIHTQFRSRLARVEGAEGGGRETKGRKDDEDLNWFRCCVLLAATGTAAFPIIYHCSSSSLLGLHVCLSVRLLLHKVKATSYRPGLVRESRVSARVSIFCLGATGTVRLGDFHCRTLAGIAAASAAITMSVCPSLRARWSYESCSMGTKTRLVLYILHGYWCKRLVFVQSVRASVRVCVPGLAAPLLLPLASSRRPPKNDNSQAERQQEEGGGRQRGDSPASARRQPFRSDAIFVRLLDCQACLHPHRCPSVCSTGSRAWRAFPFPTADPPTAVYFPPPDGTTTTTTTTTANQTTLEKVTVGLSIASCHGWLSISGPAIEKHSRLRHWH